MEALITVFKMNEISVKARVNIILRLGQAINAEYGMNITEPIVYELVKQLDPDNKEVENDHYQSIIKKFI